MVIKPMDLTRNSLNKKVKVTSRDGREFIGILSSYDESLNLVLKEAEEIYDGQTKRRGVVILKGGNTTFISKIQ